jgi:CRP-like cAMP-binding protein
MASPDADSRVPFIATIGERAGRLFPTLEQVQIDRIAAHGQIRTVQPGEVLVESGQRSARFFISRTAELEIVRPSNAGETLIAILTPGMFTGEINMLSGRRVVVRILARSAGEVIEVGHDELVRLLQTDEEIVADVGCGQVEPGESSASPWPAPCACIDWEYI